MKCFSQKKNTLKPAKKMSVDVVELNGSSEEEEELSQKWHDTRLKP